MLFIHFRDQVAVILAEHAADDPHRSVIFLVLCLNNEDDSSSLRLNMQLLRAVIDIDQQKVVKKKVLDKIIFVKPFAVSTDQILGFIDADADRSYAHPRLLPGRSECTPRCPHRLP